MLSFLMPCITVTDKYSGAILWSAHILAYMHIYTRRQAGSQLFIHISASKETMAVVHTAPVHRTFHQSAKQQVTNWDKKGKRHLTDKEGQVFMLGFSTQEGVVDVIFFIRGEHQQVGLTKNRGTCSPPLLSFSHGGLWGVKCPWWYKYVREISRTSSVRLQRLESHSSFRCNPAWGRISWRVISLGFMLCICA